MQSRFSNLISSGGAKINYGICIRCGEKPILYGHCKYCSPKCNFDAMKNKDDPPLSIPDGYEVVIDVVDDDAQMSIQEVKKSVIQQVKE